MILQNLDKFSGIFVIDCDCSLPIFSENKDKSIVSYFFHCHHLAGFRRADWYLLCSPSPSSRSKLRSQCKTCPLHVLSFPYASFASRVLHDPLFSLQIFRLYLHLDPFPRRLVSLGVDVRAKPVLVAVTESVGIPPRCRLFASSCARSHAALQMLYRAYFRRYSHACALRIYRDIALH